jgi:hypothetical protein
MKKLHLATLAALVAGPVAAATPQTTEAVADGLATVQGIASKPAEPEPKKSDLLIVPIPQSSPSLGTGVTAVGCWAFCAG